MWTLIVLCLVLAFAAYMMILSGKNVDIQWDEKPPEPDWRYEREIYEQGLMAGHLMTKAGTFDRRDLGGMSADWAASQHDIQQQAG